MILSYNDCIKKYGSNYYLKKELAAGNLFLLEKGLYSDKKTNSDKEKIAAKYPRAVFCGQSAYYYHGLTDVIPDDYFLATRREDTRIKEKNIHQTYVKDELFDIGITEIENNGATIRIYDLERMLIDLIRFRSKIPFDYYKEVINSYRNRIYEMDFSKLEEYAAHFDKKESIMRTVEREVL